MRSLWFGMGVSKAKTPYRIITALIFVELVTFRPALKELITSDAKQCISQAIISI